MRPVIKRRIEWKFLALCRRRLLPQRHHVPRVEDAIDLGIHAVELDQVEPSIQSVAFRRQVV